MLVPIPGSSNTRDAAAPADPTVPVRLAKMDPEDNPEAFLIIFERVTSAAKWPLEQWATLLAPYLTAQATYWGLPAEEAQDYGRLKAAILDALEITPDTFRQRLWEKSYPPGTRPRAVAQQLKDVCWRWLQPEQHAEVESLNKLFWSSSYISS